MKKIILVTGGNRGIGLGICKKLAEEGHTLIMGSRDKIKGEQAAEGLSGTIHVVKLDVTRNTDIVESMQYVRQNFRKLDVLINNAGIGGGNAGAKDVAEDRVKEVMEVNFYGAWHMIQTFLPLLKKSRDSRIINMSSGMGALNELRGGYAAYRLSKTALNGLTLMFAGELKGKIKVNAMCPGWVRTDMGGQAAPRSIEQGADTAVWLATGEDIPNGKFFRDRHVIPW